MSIPADTEFDALRCVEQWRVEELISERQVEAGWTTEALAEVVRLADWAVEQQTAVYVDLAFRRTALPEEITDRVRRRFLRTAWRLSPQYPIPVVLAWLTVLAGAPVDPAGQNVAGLRTLDGWRDLAGRWFATGAGAMGPLAYAAGLTPEEVQRRVTATLGTSAPAGIEEKTLRLMAGLRDYRLPDRRPDR